MLLRQLKFFIILFFSKLLHCSVEIRLAQHFISFTRHEKASMGKCIWLMICAHSALHKDVALRAEKKKALLVLPDIEKRASFAIFVYTQYYYNNFFLFLLLFALDIVEQMTSRFLFIKYTFSHQSI